MLKIDLMSTPTVHCSKSKTTQLEYEGKRRNHMVRRSIIQRARIDVTMSRNHAVHNSPFISVFIFVF